MGMEGQQDQPTGMAHIELGAISAEGFAVGTDPDAHGGGGASQPGRQHHPQSGAPSKEAFAVVRTPVGLVALVLGGREGGQQIGTGRRRQGFALLEEQKQRFRG